MSDQPSGEKWKYTYEDLARAAGMKVNTVQAHKSRGNFDPEDLWSVTIWLMNHAKPELKHRLKAAFYEGLFTKEDSAGYQPTAWYVDDSKLVDEWPDVTVSICDEGGQEVAEVQCYESIDATRRNALLIAAAPDLLSATQQCLECWESGSPIDANSDAANAVRAAMLKAEGN